MPELTPARIRAMLATSPFFSALSVADLDRVVALARRRKLREAETLFHRGDESDAVYAILAGRLRVVSTVEDGREVSSTDASPIRLARASVSTQVGMRCR